MCAWIVWIWSLSPSKNPPPDHAPIVIVIQSEHLKHSISPRDQSAKHPDSGCFGMSGVVTGSALSKGWRSGPEALRAGLFLRLDLTETGNRAGKAFGTQGITSEAYYYNSITTAFNIPCRVAFCWHSRHPSIAVHMDDLLNSWLISVIMLNWKLNAGFNIATWNINGSPLFCQKMLSYTITHQLSRKEIVETET